MEHPSYILGGALILGLITFFVGWKIGWWLRRADKVQRQAVSEAERRNHAQRLSAIRGGSHITIEGVRYKIDARTPYTTRGDKQLLWSRYTFTHEGRTLWLDIAAPDSNGPLTMLTTRAFAYGDKTDPTKLPFLDFAGHKHYLNKMGHAFYVTHTGKKGQLRYLNFQFGGGGNSRPQLERHDGGGWMVCDRKILKPQDITVVG